MTQEPDSPAGGVPTPHSGDSPRERTAALLTSIFAIVTGAVVFLPSALSALKPPYVGQALLLAFWFLAICSFVFSVFALYVLRFSTGTTTPHRTAGLAFWFASAGLLCLAVYVTANIVDARCSTPRLVSIDVEPISPHPGETIKLTGNAVDRSERILRYSWIANGTSIGTGKTIYWSPPATPTVYDVILSCDTGDQRRGSTLRVKVAITNRGGTNMADIQELLRRAIAANRELVIEKYPTRRLDIANVFPVAAVRRDVFHDIQSAEPDAVTDLLLQGAFARAVVILPEKQLFEMLGGKDRPCCSKYPGIWPFCNPKC